MDESDVLNLHADDQCDCCSNDFQDGDGSLEKLATELIYRIKYNPLDIQSSLEYKELKSLLGIY